MRVYQWLPLAIACALGSGCVGVAQRPIAQPQLPAQFSDTGTAAAPAAWWREFADAELDVLIEQALSDNLTLAATAARLRAAEASADAAGAGLVPSVSARLSETREEGGVSQQSASLSAAYEIDLWGRVRASRDAVALQAQATAQELQAARISLSASVASGWFALGSTGERLRLIGDERALYERILRLVESRYRNGQAQVSDVLRQRQLVESTRSLEASVAADLGTQRHALEELLAQPAGSSTLQGDVPMALPNLPKTGLPADLVSRRPDVQQRWLQLQSADRGLAAAIANRFPQLDLSATASTSDMGAARLFDDWIGSLVGSLFAPLIDGGARRAEVARNRAVLEQRIAEYRSAVLIAFREVQDALVRDTQQQIRVTSLIEQLRLSDQVVDRLERQLRNGSDSYLSLLDAQLTNSSLKREVVSARQLHAEQRISLFRSLAGPLPDAPRLSLEPTQ